MKPPTFPASIRSAVAIQPKFTGARTGSHQVSIQRGVAGGWTFELILETMMMKFSSLFVGASLLLASRRHAGPGSTNFRPERGVRCDEFARVCYERGMPSQMTGTASATTPPGGWRGTCAGKKAGYGARTFYP